MVSARPVQPSTRISPSGSSKTLVNPPASHNPPTLQETPHNFEIGRFEEQIEQTKPHHDNLWIGDVPKNPTDATGLVGNLLQEDVDGCGHQLELCNFSFTF